MTLDQYMTQNNLTDGEFAARIKRGKNTVWRWRACRRFPSARDQALIYNATGGMVTPNDWVGVGPRIDGVKHV